MGSKERMAAPGGAAFRVKTAGTPCPPPYCGGDMGLNVARVFLFFRRILYAYQGGRD